LDQAVYIGRFPLEFAVSVISGADIGVEEKLASVGERPVFWDCVLGFWVFFGGFDKGF
jgi:hypothetical protein